MSVRRIDALRFGGFDEHESLRGYICGPNDLGWRLVNAGLPEIWHDERVCLFHFAHPHSNQFQNEGAWKEMRYPHIDHHALTSVQAFCSGRLLPLVENPDIHKLRMSMRRIGTKLEERFAWMQPLSRSAIARRRLYLVVGNVLGAARAFLGPIPGVRPVNRAVRRLLTTMGGRAAGI
jgi:hypothetical protein